MKKQRFTGGDELTGFEKYLHHVLMLNELGGGVGGYELADAKIGKSGYSFGGNQMDLSNNREARNILRDILLIKNLSKEQIKASLEKFEKKGKFDHFSTNSDVSLINAALGSEEGVKEINKAYVKEIKANAEHIDSVIKKAHKDLQPFLKDPVVKLILADYHNQFHLDANGKMHNLLKGKTVQFAKEVTLDIAAIKTPDDLIKQLREAIYATKWGQDKDGKRDIARRQGNIDKVAAEFIPASEHTPAAVVPPKSEKTYPANGLIAPSLRSEPKSGQPEARPTQASATSKDRQGIHARRLEIMERRREEKAETTDNSRVDTPLEAKVLSALLQGRGVGNAPEKDKCDAGSGPAKNTATPAVDEHREEVRGLSF